MALLVFSHANSFPAGTYGVMFRSLRSRGFLVKSVDRFGHDPKYPVTDNWPHLVQQLHDFAAKEVEKVGEPAVFVGHSLGGFLSLMCAARHPRLAAAVVLLDAPLLGGWKARALAAIKRTPMVGSLTPGAVSRKRKNRWPDLAGVEEHFRHKAAFGAWNEDVLLDYVRHGTRDEDGMRVLSFDRDIETTIYNTLPHHLDRLLAKHPLRCPAAFVGGVQSQEMQQVGMDMTRRVCRERIAMLDGTHLFPMEKPVATAAAIESAVRGMLPAAL